MVSDKFKMHVVEVFFTFLAFISLAVFIKALDVKYNQFFVNNTNTLLFSSGIAILFFIVVGKITGYSLRKKSIPTSPN